MNGDGAGSLPDWRPGSLPDQPGFPSAESSGGVEKAELRRRILAWRDGLPPEQVTAWSAAIARRLFSLAAFRRARTVLFYLSFRNEVATPPMISRALGLGKRVCLPEVVPEGRRLVPRLVRPAPVWEARPFSPAAAVSAGLVPGPMGLWQPDPSRCPAVPPADIDLVLVPGVAFDRRGHRLGFGQGYYDRFLPALPGHAQRVGLAFGGQVVEAVPAAPWDVPLHRLVTEARVVKCAAVIL